MVNDGIKKLAPFQMPSNQLSRLNVMIVEISKRARNIKFYITKHSQKLENGQPAIEWKFSFLFRIQSNYIPVNKLKNKLSFRTIKIIDMKRNSFYFMYLSNIMEE